VAAAKIIVGVVALAVAVYWRRWHIVVPSLMEDSVIVKLLPFPGSIPVRIDATCWEWLMVTPHAVNPEPLKVT